MASRRQGAVLVSLASVGGHASGAVWKAVTGRRCAVRCERAFSQYGDTALVAAARRGHKETVELLVHCGADVQAKGRVSAEIVPHCATDRGRRHSFGRGPQWRRGVKLSGSCRVLAWEALLEGLAGSQ